MLGPFMESLLGFFLFAAPESGDSAAFLVDEFRYRSTLEIQQAGLEEAQLSSLPWSGWYWPVREGGLARRLADPKFPAQVSWPEIREFLVRRIGTGPKELWSPSEKYDDLLGDPSFTLTWSMIRLGDRLARRGTIPAWFGFCAGWAGAAMNMPEPVRSVRVRRAGSASLTEGEVIFTPEDLKALAALHWTSGLFPIRSAGRLCEENPVRRRGPEEREESVSCRDVSPATLHLALVNQVGSADRALLMDSDPGHEVWNQPIFSYRFHYRNPRTREPAAALEQAKIRLQDWPEDPFRSWRTPSATQAVAVSASVRFVAERGPEAAGAPEEEHLRTVLYEYDLELDDHGRILGGEWQSSLHPDLLWVSAPRAFPQSSGDRALLESGDRSAWIPAQPLPENWVAPARSASARGEILSRILRHLFAWSL
jgi:hypothetical protein